MTINSEIQKLEPGAIVQVFELDAEDIGAGTLRFHGYPQDEPIWWQGKRYEPWAIEATGFQRVGEGRQPAPTVRVGNIGLDSQGKRIPGVISAMCRMYGDLVGARFIRRRTLAKYLDAANFEAGNSTADPTQAFPDEVWLIEQRTSSNAEIVEFELSSPLDFQGQQLPARQITTQCAWTRIGGYRGPYCGYTGSAMFDKNDNPVSDPALDRCPGFVRSCQIRFAAQQGCTPTEAEINFGGEPAADRLR